MQTNLGGHVHGGVGGTFGLKLNKVKPTLKVDLSGQSSGHLQVQSHPIPRFQLPRTLHQETGKMFGPQLLLPMHITIEI